MNLQSGCRADFRETTRLPVSQASTRLLCLKDRGLDRLPGFTLTEVLVVIAIVGVMATLLLPILRKGREAARMSVCLSNLRQVSVAAGSYAADNGGSFPPFWNWLHATSGQAGFPQDITTGALYPYLKNKATYLCPTDRLALNSGPEARSKSVTSIRNNSYAMNCALCHQHDASKFLAPDRTLLWMEANLDREDNGGVAGPVAGPSACKFIPEPISTRHSGLGHLLYADLHVQRVSSIAAARLARSKRFWLPTDDDPFNLFLVLTDP
jgi:prepilin-type N-terminal cleavage/methylation domain-containing protein/prepilin-type processing-associated H-X9-DG protein